jgi:hypothetical protein
MSLPSSEQEAERRYQQSLRSTQGGLTSGTTLPSSAIGGYPSSPGYHDHVTGQPPPQNPWGPRGLYSSSSEPEHQPGQRPAGAGRYGFTPAPGSSPPPRHTDMSQMPYDSPRSQTPRPGTAGSTGTTDTWPSPSAEAYQRQLARPAAAQREQQPSPTQRRAPARDPRYDVVSQVYGATQPDIVREYANPRTSQTRRDQLYTAASDWQRSQQQSSR